MRTKSLCGLWAALSWVSVLVAGCSCSESVGSDDGGGRDGGTADMDGSTADRDGGATDMDATAEQDGGGPVEGGAGEGGVIPVDGGFLLPDGAVVPCLPASCAGRTYACGDCLDNDGDGLLDARDPGCIGPCDNSEDRYDLEIPGGDTPTCLRECYYDDNQGPGNDGCEWNESCDPLMPDPLCPFTGPGGPVRCPEVQDERCYETCLPLVPNGCDCFGCCELPAGSGRYVFLGSTDEDGNHTCTPETIHDETRCRRCTPVPGCLNRCGPCEICLGRTELPPECFPARDGGVPPRDGGVPLDDAGRPIDAGPQPDGGTPPPRCESGRQACGLPGDPPCPDGWYCLTGCCIYFG